MRLHAYKNLHRDAWSLRSLSTGRVTEHALHVEIHDVTFRVQQGGREAVLRDGIRRVHAYVVGEVVARGARRKPMTGRWTRFTYNPYRAGTFTIADPKNPRPVYGADRVRLDPDGAWLQGPRYKER
jgi:hypothetical protein